MRQMKESGIEWIGAIPFEWHLYPAKYAFSEIRTKNTDGKVSNALKFFNGTIIPKSNFVAESDEYVAETITNYTVVEPDTIMINGLNLNYDLKSLRVGLVKESGIITSAYLALKPDESRIIPQYATYLFKGYEAKMAFHNMGAGIRKTLGFKEFKSQPVLFPSLNEQIAIVNFLDRQCAYIDIIITKTKDSIEEYKKLKQAIITQAVTKGVRGDRPLKDSGIEWIGEIPEEWRLCKIKYLHNGLTDGTHGTYQRYDTGRVLLSSKNVRENNLSISDSESCISEEDYLSIVSKGFPKKDDILLCCIGASIGRCILYPYDEPHAFQRSVIFIRCNDKIIPQYMRYCLLSSLTLAQEQLLINQSAQAGLYQGLVSDIVVSLPPLAEQKEIAAFIDVKAREIDDLIRKKERLLEEIDIYKKTMIYEYVTGKKEVPLS